MWPVVGVTVASIALIDIVLFKTATSRGLKFLSGYVFQFAITAVR